MLLIFKSRNFGSPGIQQFYPLNYFEQFERNFFSFALRIRVSAKNSTEHVLAWTYDDESRVLQSTETHDITLKNLALFRPKLRDSYSTNQSAGVVNYYCYGVNVIELSIRLKN